MIYTVATSKGGTAKTTTAAAIAQAAASKGRRALAIDLDPQSNLTYCLAADARAAGAYEILHGTPAADVIQTTPQGIDVISASLNLQTEKSAPGSARRLQEALDPIRRKYSIIVIDTPATAGELQYNALQAADRLIIPLEADAYNVQSIYQIAEAAAYIPHLKIAGVLLVKYDGRATLSKQLQERLKAEAAKLHIPYLGTVRKAIAIQEAAALQRSLFEYAPKSKPAADYMAIYEKLTK